MDRHLSPVEALSYVDGELSWLERLRASRHLRACWTCRLQIERLEDTIHTAVDAHETALSPTLAPPPHRWIPFDALVRPLHHEQASLSAKRTSSWMIPAGAAVLLILVTVLVMRTVVRPSVVSASEVLRRIEQADTKRETFGHDEVVRQRVVVQRVNLQNRRRQSGSFSAWKSPGGSCWQNTAGDDVVKDLQSRYRYDVGKSTLPLSAASIGAWTGPNEGAAHVEQHGEVLVLHFEPEKASHRTVQPSPVVDLEVSQSDWQIQQATFQFSDASFVIRQQDFNVLPAAAVPQSLLAVLEPDLKPAIPAAKPSIVAAVPLAAAAIKQAELNVFQVLDNLHADLGEPISVDSTPHGVTVAVWQLPQERQQEIADAMAPFQDITVERKPAAQRTDIASTTRQAAVISDRQPVSISNSESSPIESDSRVLKTFGTVDAERRFGREALDKSDIVLAHAFALRNLARRFSGTDESLLPESSRQDLEALIHHHALAGSRALSDLQNSMTRLNTIYGANAGDIDIDPITVAGTWHERAQHALQLAQQTDDTLRSLVTASATPVDPQSAVPDISRKLSELASELLSLEQPDR